MTQPLPCLLQVFSAGVCSQLLVSAAEKFCEQRTPSKAGQVRFAMPLKVNVPGISALRQHDSHAHSSWCTDIRPLDLFAQD